MTVLGLAAAGHLNSWRNDQGDSAPLRASVDETWFDWARRFWPSLPQLLNGPPRS